MSTDLPDVNVLYAAVDPDHEHHDPAREWMMNTPSYAISPTTASGLVRLLINPRVPGRTTDFRTALTIVRRLRENGRASFWQDDVTIDQLHFTAPTIVGPKQITDLGLVNLAAKNHGRLVTFDGKIKRALRPEDQHLVHVLIG